MLNIWKKIFNTGVVTEKDPFIAPSEKRRGKLIVDPEKCQSCNICVSICPVNAIDLIKMNNEAKLTFDYAKCMYCSLCVESCPDGAITHTLQMKESVKHSSNLKESFYVKLKNSKQKEGV